MAMPRDVIVNGNTYTIYSDMQTDHDDHSCRNLIKTNGRCGIYEIRPFSCDFELIRFICFDDDTMLTTKLYGRGWNMLRIDGKRGARCEIVDRTDETCADVTRKLRRLKQWTDYFELKTWLPEIIEWSLNRHQREGPCKLPHDDTGHRFYHCT
jgi:Fe-S-cluster containining protein